VRDVDSLRRVPGGAAEVALRRTVPWPSPIVPLQRWRPRITPQMPSKQLEISLVLGGQASCIDSMRDGWRVELDVGAAACVSSLISVLTI